MPSKALKNILLVSLPALLICLLLAEFVVFRWFIPACEPPLYSYDQHFKLLHLEPETSGLFTAGRFARLRGRWQANNFGWNSEIDYVAGAGDRQPLVAVIGDSYVEGLQVNLNERFPVVLQHLLGPDPLVYNFGISGAGLSQYLHMSRYVNQVFKPQILVILVVHNDFDESLANLRRIPRFLQIAWQDGAFVEIPPLPFQPSPYLRFFRHSAIYRYMEMNGDLYHFIKKLSIGWTPPPKPTTYNANIEVDAVAQQRDLIRQGTRFLVAKMRAENPEKRLIIMMDGPRFDIYAHNLANSNVRWLNELMRDACRESRIEFLDLTEPFAQNFEQYHRLLENPEDGHWNKYGHEIAGKALWLKLKETGALPR